ncbi:MAG: EamA family transporter [Clostridia bacterium]|nr:EamA family transporter [Clostridia bacterium]
MNILMLMLVVVGVSLQQIGKKAYNLKVKNGIYSFTAASSFMALLVFLITAKGEFNYSPDFLIYSVIFAISFCVASVASYSAVSTGPLSLTSLFISYSLIIPTFYGIIVLGEETKATLYLGIILLLISLILTNLEGKQEKKITFKWIILVLIASVGNGACSVIQKAQQINCNQMYKSEFMIIALIITVAVIGIFALLNEKKEITYNLKHGVKWYLICGIANGIVNYLVIVLSGRMDASLMFPIISSGGIILTALVSIFIYKEKLSKQQYVGFILGILSIIALNL